jgi:hypothetical protein
MTGSALVFDEVVFDLTRRVMAEADESRVEPLVNQESGRPDGLVVDTALERVLAVVRNREVLSPADIGEVRRLMAGVQARRALLYVPFGSDISNPVKLLASLSRIRIVPVPSVGAGR